MIRPLLSTAVLGALTAASHASVSFSNFTFDPIYFGSGPVVSGNALTWFPTDEATAGDVSSTDDLTLTFGFDAIGTSPLVSSFTLGQGFTFGSGVASFTQTVYALDAGGNVTSTLGTVTSGSDTNTVSFSPSSRIRVVSSYRLTATDDQMDFDYSGLTLINQNVSSVPGPGALTAFAVGGLGVLRRRRKTA